MTKSYPTVKVNEIIKVLIYLGYSEAKRKGTSHRKFERSGKRPIPVPDHNNQIIKSGLFSAMLKQMEIDRDTFFDILNKKV